MFNQIFAISIKEFKVLLHDRAAFITLFLLPIAFIVVMTVALEGVFDSGSEDNPISLLIVNLDQGSLAEEVLSDLRTLDGLILIEDQAGIPLTRAAAEQLIIDGQVTVALVFPEDFTSTISQVSLDSESTSETTVTFISDPTVTSQILSPIKGMVQGYIERRAAEVQMANRLNEGFTQWMSQADSQMSGQLQAAEKQAISGISASSQSGSGVTYEIVSPADYHITRSPTSVEQNVPGYTIYGVFFIMQTIATSFFREKNDGTYRRLQAAPLSKAVYLIGKLIPYYLINLIQIALMFGIGVVIFHLNLGNSPVGLILTSLATAAAATGLGMFITSLGKTIEQVSSLSTLLSVILAAIGGMMVPASVMPSFMQKIALITPHAWALSAYQDIIVRGMDAGQILPSIGILLLFALLFWGIALWRFRYE